MIEYNEELNVDLGGLGEKSILDGLAERFPLSSSWSKPEVFQEDLMLGRDSIRMFGVMTRHSSGETVVGSAAEIGNTPYERGYFELIERASIFEFMQSECAEHKESSLFWRPAKSNGVALHTIQEQARLSAVLELVERDRILRTWFGEHPPQKIQDSRFQILSSIEKDYDIQVYRFTNSADPLSDIEVLGMFGFPKSTRPILFGFGAGFSMMQAFDRAYREFIQRLGFLWDEEFSDDIQFSPTPEYHLGVHHHPRNKNALMAWLSGAHQGLARFHDAAKRQKGGRATSVEYQDITPLHFQGKLFVVKATDESRMPLVFGRGHPWVHSMPEELQVHPIA